MTKTIEQRESLDADAEERPGGPSRSGSITADTESRSPTAIAAGSRLLQRFELGPQLGSGGMGVVHEAIDRQLGVPVALKFLHHFGPRAVYRLKREFSAMNALEPHPNLITPSGLFCEHGVWFVSMELVRGEQFLRYVRPDGVLDGERLRSALSQLALGLSVMHRAGLVHRDLKPSNVLITSEGRLVILDFGLVNEAPIRIRASPGRRATWRPSRREASPRPRRAIATRPA